MDLNPLFTGVTAFRPAANGGELKLFEHAGIKLVHGWLVDPNSPEYQAISRVEDYDTAVNLVAEADHLSRGRLVPDHVPSSSSSSQAALSLSSHDEATIRDGRLTY
jgi:ubiquitin carboxyl-terminal hydrolase MINDY-1/2